ncbi:MAG: YdbH domain-containing protein [Pseudomonadota bacterium]
MPLFLLGGGAAAWVFRVPIAETIIQRECDARGLTCDFELTGLQVRAVTFEAVSLSGRPGEVPLTTRRLDIALAWEGITPQIVAVAADQARLVATFDGSDFSLGGLETVLPDGAGNSGLLPRIDVQNGTLILNTPAGTLGGDFDFALESRTQARLRAQLRPADLASGEAVLKLNASEVDLTLLDGRLAGVAEFEIENGAFGDFNVRSVLLRAEVAPSASGLGDTLVYRLASRELSYGAIDVLAATSRGTIVLAGNGIDPSNPMAGIGFVSGTFEADALRAPGVSVGGLAVDLELENTASGQMDGPLALTAETSKLNGFTESGALAMTGTLSTTPERAVSFDGQVTVRDMALAEAQLDRLEPLLLWPAPTTAHGQALLAALRPALRQFDTGARLMLERSPEGSLEVQARGPTRLTSETGVSLAMLPFGEGPWIQGGPTGLTLRGAVALSGGGAPDVSTQINELSLRDGSISLKLGETDLQDWSEDERMLGAGLSRFEMVRSPDRLVVVGQGAIRFSGQTGGIAFDGLNLFGAVDAVRGSEGWRAQLGGGRCLSLAFDRLTHPTLELGAITTSLCPEDGRIARQAEAGSSGTLSLDAISVPFSLGGSSGDLRLPSSTLDWTLGDQVSASLALARLSMDLRTGPRELLLSSGQSDIDFLLGDGGLEATGRMRGVVFGGSLIPANAVADRFDFRLRALPKSLSGTADIAGVSISDYRDDPLYTPMEADLSAELIDGVVQLIGPVRLAETGRHVANTDIRVSFPAVDGLIRVRGYDLEFRPGDLQPSALSERLRGFFTDARGALDAEARIRIDGGTLSGTGDLTFRDIGFQTVALGRVTGVNGSVSFSDLLALQSPPGQTVTVASVDPGLALNNGTLSFELTGGGSATLERALWPFAGGVLAVEPTRWDMGAVSRRLTVRADRIGLADVSKMLQLPGFMAEGTVSGRFPMVFEPGIVRIVDATLVADGNGGVLQYTGGVGAEAGIVNERVATAFEALENFQFTVLQLGANGDLLGDVTLTARLEGRNPDVLDGSPFNFNISLDSQLGQLLSTARQLNGVDWLAQVQAEQAYSSAQ